MSARSRARRSEKTLAPVTRISSSAWSNFSGGGAYRRLPETAIRAAE